MTRFRRISAFVMIFLLVSVGMVYAADEIDKKTLKGLKGVRVMVELLSPDIEKDGLRRNSIYTDVEVKLRVAGIKVLTIEEWAIKSDVILYVCVHSLKLMEIYFYVTYVELHQKVLLERDPKIIRSGITTWEAIGIMGTVGAENVNSIRDKIKDQVDEFINDYLAVNPK